MKTEEYFKRLKQEVDRNYAFAQRAKEKNLDPVNKVEVPLAMSMAEKVVGLISSIYPQMENTGIAKRIADLEEKYGKLDSTIVFKIAEEVSKEKFCKFENKLQSIEAGVRIGFAYITLGVVSSPIEGFTGLKTRKRRDNGKEYLEASFSGPIRSAGTTASCVVLTLIDYLREVFGYAKYDPTEEEIKRVYAELEHFHDRITNLQYMPTEEEANFIAKNMPIQIAGDPSEKIEVPNYKNLERVDTNFLRSGFCLIMAEGLAQKAPKGFRLLKNAKKNGIKSTGFDWLKEYVELHEKQSVGKSEDGGPPTYIKDLVAGRPIYGHPQKSGGFRFRYGRGRTSGFSAASLHPATMAVVDNFIANGTQLKIEKPTKGCAVTSCDSIEGPIIKLSNGTVKKLKTKEDAERYYNDIEEIIYLGDILFPFGDVINRNADLIKPGYVEEWWNLELKQKNNKLDVDFKNISFEEAKEISKKEKVSLHPKYIFYWTEIPKEYFSALLNWLRNSWIKGKLIFPYSQSNKEKFSQAKRALELLGVEHEVTTENVVLKKEESKIFLLNLGINFDLIESSEKPFKEFLRDTSFEEKNVLEIVNNLSNFVIRDKAGDFVGARMGRPEKAKLRKLTGSPNMIFPVGQEGGKMRSLQAAYLEGKINSDFPIYFCEKCSKNTIYPSCEECGKKTKKMYKHSKEGDKSFEIMKDDVEGMNYERKNLDIKHFFDKAIDNLKLNPNEIPKLIKGVRGTSSKNHAIENLEKGILRAKYGLRVNKDGTIRLDATELPLTHFKPKEIFVSIKKLKELGYDEDIYGKKLVNEEQILELMPHDVLLPSCQKSLDEKADDVFLKISQFVDEELERFYGLPRFYYATEREDLVGQLGVCMAPHNCGGVICRFIGFSNTQGLLASPYMHAAIRRDCDGDEAAVMMLEDVLLNFSKEFLPAHRGGTQDAPLVLNAKINAGEVDDQILDFAMCSEYPLELYEKAEKRKHSSEVKEILTVKDALKKGEDPFRNLQFTHDTVNFNDGVSCSAYKFLGQMQEKVQHQMELVEKLRSVDTSDTARLIIERHFLRDLKGNLRKFSQQDFRCVKCNKILRRPPLEGTCPVCGGKIIFTIHEGGIKKYLDPAITLSKKYHLSKYLKQSLDLVKRYIDSIFGKELEKQKDLDEWFS